jgi:formate dehydrogenase subunit gamma
MNAQMRLVPRYRLAQRLAHWIFAAAFFVLLFSGLALFVPAVSEWTASAQGRLAHRVAAIGLMLAPVFYLVADRKGLGQLVRDSFTYDKDDRAWFAHFIPYVFGKAKNLPPQGRINAGEKLHHAAVILGFLVIAISGLMLWFWDGMSAPMRLTTLMVHDVAMLALAVLTIGHTFFVFVYGAFSGMWNGFVTELYARVEHPKWLAQMENEGKIITR